ncbi:MAG: manganese efflux pump [Deltaproteobacteria bacterium]|nr:manganese efflux pump [Deltaproteobacteria bacterium]
MDAFAVALATGLTLSPLARRQVFRLSFHFGFFQAAMPVLGWGAGVAVHGYIESVDHWVAFGLLGFVGGKMLWEALHHEEGADERTAKDPTRGWALVLLSIATSIDALAVGLSLAMVGTPIAVPALVIGLVAAFLTAVGMLIGRRIGAAWGRRVEVLGGLVLIAIGVRILFEHLRA